MNTPAAAAGGGRRTTPDHWRAIATLTARAAARDHPDQWAATGLPPSLADLEVAVETLWAGVELAKAGADHTTLAETLGLTDAVARRIIIATTE